MFVMFRLVFGSLIFVICFALIRKLYIIRKQLWLISAFIMAIIITTISALIPIENAFVTFSSPQSAYNYNNSGSVKLIVNGEKTDFIVGSKGDTNVYIIVPKSNDGWKLGMGLDTKRIAKTISDGISVYVYQYKNSDDYYISVLDTSGGPSDVTDNRSSKFQCLEKSNSALNETFYTYYAYVNDYNDQYVLTVNGKTIKIQN